MKTSAEIASSILALLRQRDPASSICPSDVARALSDDEAQWRPLMPQVREAARMLAHGGAVVMTQGEAVIDPNAPLQGRVRLRRGPAVSGDMRGRLGKHWDGSTDILLA